MQGNARKTLDSEGSAEIVSTARACNGTKKGCTKGEMAASASARMRTHVTRRKHACTDARCQETKRTRSETTRLRTKLEHRWGGEKTTVRTLIQKPSWVGARSLRFCGFSTFVALFPSVSGRLYGPPRPMLGSAFLWRWFCQ